MSKSRKQSNLTTPNNGQGDAEKELNKSVNNMNNVSSMLDISGLSAFAIPEDQARLSVGGPSDLG